MLCALIMAGGRGTRFWPQSTEERPKQFLNLVGDKTMIQITYDRINKLVNKEHIFICTNKKYKDLVKTQIAGIDDKNIILEPCGKNTAPCILLSSLYINSIYPNTNIATISSDHIIENEDKFNMNIDMANSFVNDNKDAIVTIGIKPDRPETGYGYIKFIHSSNTILKVDRFVEKPTYELAVDYVNSGHYLWNAGMFIFNVNSMLKELSKNLPLDYELLKDLPSIDDENYYRLLDEKYDKCTKISIDYAVIEKSDNIYTIESDIGWDDIGTWNSLERYLEKDSDGNIKKGNDVKLINSKNNIVYSNNDKKVILSNVEDLFFIDSDNVIIIGKRDRIDEVPDFRNE